MSAAPNASAGRHAGAEAERAADVEALRQAVEALREQVADLSGAAGAAAASHAEKASEDISGGIDEAARRGREARIALEQTVHDRPMLAIGVAAGLGLLLGLAMRR